MIIRDVRIRAGENAKITPAPAKAKVSKDLEYLIAQGRIAAFFSPFQKCRIDNAFKKDVLIPALLMLYEKCPNGYKLLMEGKHNWKIRIMKYNAAPFYSSAYYKYKNFDYKASPYANTLQIYPDKVIVNVDNYTTGSALYAKQSLYCEILQVISNLALPDQKTGAVSDIGTYLNARYKEKLDKITKNYLIRLERADYELKKKWSATVTIDNFQDFYKSYAEIMNKNRCWLQMKILPEDCLSMIDFSRNMMLGPKNNQDTVIYGLLLYFGGIEEKQRLKKQEPELYNLIENIAVPIINKAAK